MKRRNGGPSLDQTHFILIGNHHEEIGYDHDEESEDGQMFPADVYICPLYMAVHSFQNGKDIP